MKRLRSIAGIQGFVYLIVGALLVFFGFQTPDLVDDFNIYWMMTASSFVLGILLFFSKGGENLALTISRIVVGGLFIVSGLIKANDTVGFGYKLEEYFEPEALGESWAIFHEWSQTLSFLISGAEVLLGLAVIIGAWPRLTSTLILIMTLFFAWLTNFTADCVSGQRFYNGTVSKMEAGDAALLSGDLETGAISYERMFVKYDQIPDRFTDTIGPAVEARREIDVDNPDTSMIMAAQKLEVPGFSWKCVDDCGCFGDALKGSVGRSLTPRESFYKDMFLLFFVLVYFFKQGKISLNEGKQDLILIPVTLILVALFGGGLFGWWFPLIFTLVAFIVYILAKKLLGDKKGKQWVLAGIMALMCYGFAAYTYTYLPIKDYRPYKVGDSLIRNRMTVDEINQILPADEQVHADRSYVRWLFRNRNTQVDTLVVDTAYMNQRLWDDSIFKKRYIAVDYDYELRTVYDPGYSTRIYDFQMQQYYNQISEEAKKDSAIAAEIEMNYDPGYSEDYWQMRHVAKDSTVLVLKSEFKDSLYPMEDGTWEFVKDTTVVVVPPSSSKIDLADYMLSKPRMLWIISYELSKANKEKLKEIKDLATSAEQNGVEVAFISSPEPEVAQKVMDETGFYFPYYICDATELKIVVRSNPGIVYLESGVVKGKWDYNRIPEYKDLK